MVHVPLRKRSSVIKTIEISDEEKAQAILTRKKFENLMDCLEDSFEHLNGVNGALAEVDDSSQLEPLRKLFKQYRRRTQTVFNELIDKLEEALLEMNKTVSDSEMERIQDMVVAEIGEIRDGVEKLLVLLKEPQEPRFVENFTKIVERLNARKLSLVDIIQEGLYSHIDYDILSRVRLG